jgi:methylmalonyl-CoA mutase N-terminal domain/subunit
LTVDKEVQEKQRARLERVKNERDDDAVKTALTSVEDAIESDENVMPAIIEAVKAYATMGEIMAVFEGQYGTYQETIGVA